MYLIRIFVAILISFLLRESLHAAVLLDRVVAVVNKEVITWSELYKMMEYEATDLLRDLNEKEKMKIFKENEADFLDKLIDMRLQIQEARRLGFDITPKEVKEAIENIKEKYLLNDREFEKSLKREGLNFEEYKERLSEQMLISQFVNNEIRRKIVISDEDVKRYIEENKNEFGDGEAFKIIQIFFKKPKDDEAKKIIDENALLIIQKLKKGEDFSELARNYSEDPSAESGGDLGYIKKSQMAKEFIDMLSNLKKGEFSSPFWTDRGLHIVKLDDKISVSMQNFEEIKENIRKQLVEARFLEKYKNYIKSLRESAHIQIRL